MNAALDMAGAEVEALRELALPAEFAGRQAACDTGQPRVEQHTLADAPFLKRDVCFRVLTQSGSTWTESVVGELLRTTCDRADQCVYEAQHDPKEALYGLVSATWPRGTIRSIKLSLSAY